MLELSLNRPVKFPNDFEGHPDSRGVVRVIEEAERNRKTVRLLVVVQGTNFKPTRVLHTVQYCGSP